MDNSAEPCQFLQWDTDFFGHRIARLNGNRLDPLIVQSVYAWSEANAIDCLYFLAEADDLHTIRLAEDHGFRLVEVRLNTERKLADWNPDTRARAAEDVSIRFGRTEDIPAVQAIARNSYVDSRFYFDERFSKEKWQAYYQTWVKNSFEGRADLRLVAEKEGEIVGYITGLVAQGKPEGQYELTGVRESARKSGVGQELFRSGLDWYVRNGIGYVWLATQGRNIATQRMVQRNGFITKSCQLYYHKWLDQGSTREATR
jgi:ribosomal protein S18 acetylase RimI-like enzyme